MKPLVPISATSLFLFTALCWMPPSAKAQWQGVNEKKWAELIESDIQKGASAETICTNSTNFATTSNEDSFKNWASSIAQEYCTEGVTKTEATAPIANNEEECRLDSSDIYRISLGEKVHKSNKGCWSSFNWMHEPTQHPRHKIDPIAFCFSLTWVAWWIRWRFHLASTNHRMGNHLSCSLRAYANGLTSAWDILQANKEFKMPELCVANSPLKSCPHANFWLAALPQSRAGQWWRSE